jgi:hypothetical protein
MVLMFKNIFLFDPIMVGATKNIFSVAPTIFTISQTTVASAWIYAYDYGDCADGA